VTVGQRSKEYAHDYRYFPEPDLPPLTFTPEQVARIDDTLPELPAARRERFMVQFGLPEMDADRLTATRDIADYFELAAYRGPDPAPTGSAPAPTGAVPAPTGPAPALTGPEPAPIDKVRGIANLIVNDVLKGVPDDTSLADLPMTPAHVVELLQLVDAGVITIGQARQLVPDIIRTGQPPRRLVEERGMAQITDDASLAPSSPRLSLRMPMQRLSTII